MRKVFNFALLLGVLLVGCGKEKVEPVTEVVAEKAEAVQNSYFSSEVENENYFVSFDYYTNSYEKYLTNVDVNKVESSEFGDVYEILLVGDFDVVEERKNIGYFLVTNNLIVKLKDKETKITEVVTEENAKNIGVVVCSENDAEYKLEQDYGEVTYSIEHNGEDIIFKSSANYDAGSYKKFVWKKGVGLVQYVRGTDAEGPDLTLDLANSEYAEKSLEKTMKYAGTIGDSNVHMELNYYDDGSVTGSYYYDKYNQEIGIVGTRNNNVLNLVTDDKMESFDGRIHSWYMSGNWSGNGKAVGFDLWNEGNDEYSSNMSNFIAHGDYMYYTQEDGIYNLNLETGRRDLIVYTEHPSNLTIYNNYLYYFADENLYKSSLDGIEQESFSLGINELSEEQALNGLEIYKGRVYMFGIDYSDSEENTNFIITTNLEGGDKKEIECPQYRETEYGDYAFTFNERFIYNDYIYFQNSDPMGASMAAYRMKIDGTGAEELGWDMEFSGAGSEYYFTGWCSQVFIITRNYVDLEKNKEPFNIYTEEDKIQNYNGAIKGVTINNEYIVNCLDDRSLDYYKVKVFDFEGNIVKEVQIERPVNKSGDRETFRMGIVDDYVYFALYSDGYVDRMGRFKISGFGSEVEQYDTLNDDYFLAK